MFISCGFFSVKCCLRLEMKQRDLHKLQLTDKYLLFISCGFFLVKCCAQQMYFTKSDRRLKVCLHLVSAHPSLRQHQGEMLQLQCQCPLAMTVTPFTVRVLFVPQLVQILMFLFLFLFCYCLGFIYRSVCLVFNCWTSKVHPWHFMHMFCWSCEMQCAHPCWWDTTLKKWPFFMRKTVALGVAYCTQCRQEVTRLF